MLMKEKIMQNETDYLIRTYSDTYTIIQIETGTEYVEAIDSPYSKYTYRESTNLLPVEENEIVEDEVVEDKEGLK